MMTTNYKIVKEDESYTVLKDGAVEAKGFLDESSALHGIWATEGKNPIEWFTLVDGAVVKTFEDKV